MTQKLVNVLLVGCAALTMVSPALANLLTALSRYTDIHGKPNWTSASAKVEEAYPGGPALLLTIEWVSTKLGMAGGPGAWEFGIVSDDHHDAYVAKCSLVTETMPIDNARHATAKDYVFGWP